MGLCFDSDAVQRYKLSPGLLLNLNLLQLSTVGRIMKNRSSVSKGKSKVATYRLHLGANDFHFSKRESDGDKTKFTIS